MARQDIDLNKQEYQLFNQPDDLSEILNYLYGFLLSLIKIKCELKYRQVCPRISKRGSNSITSQLFGLIPVIARMKWP